jgi:outer membrane murein-binding lipoprotein Lpp
MGHRLHRCLDPGYEQRKMQHEWRMQQLKNEIEQIKNDSEQIARETEQLRQENARGRQRLASIDALCFPPECSSTSGLPRLDG